MATKAGEKNGALKLADGRALVLVGVMEAAPIVGVERSRFARWMKPIREWRKAGSVGPMPDPLGELPKPIFDLGCGPIWLKADIEKFAKDFAQRRHAGATA